MRNRDIDWHVPSPFKPDWGGSSRFIAFTIHGKEPLYAAFNAHFNPMTITLPSHANWQRLVLTSEDWDQHHLLDRQNGPLISGSIELPPHSALLASAGYQSFYGLKRFITNMNIQKIFELFGK